MVDKSSIIEKIKKLYRLSKSSNEHEAALAAAKAQELLAQHNLSEADFSEKKILKQAETAFTATVKKPTGWVFILAASVSGAFDCQYFHCSSGHTVFVGVDVDHEAANFTFSYLYRTISKLAAVFMQKSQQKRLTVKGQKKVRLSYCLGAAQVVSQKLAKQKVITPITTTALVPVKHALICAKMESEGVKHVERKPEDLSDRAYWSGRHDGANIDHGRRGVPAKKNSQLRIG